MRDFSEGVIVGSCAMGMMALWRIAALLGRLVEKLVGR